MSSLPSYTRCPPLVYEVDVNEVDVYEVDVYEVDVYAIDVYEVDVYEVESPPLPNEGGTTQQGSRTFT